MGRPITDNMQENVPPADFKITPGAAIDREGLPVISGPVSLVCPDAKGRSTRTPILLKVYKSAFFGCYAVLAPDKKAAIKDSGAISLRKCSVHVVPEAERSESSAEHQFRVTVEGRREGTSMMFCTSSEDESVRWVKTLRQLTSPLSKPSSSPIAIPTMHHRKCPPLQATGQQIYQPAPKVLPRKGISPSSLPSLQEEDT